MSALACGIGAGHDIHLSSIASQVAGGSCIVAMPGSSHPHLLGSSHTLAGQSMPVCQVVICEHNLPYVPIGVYLQEEVTRWARNSPPGHGPAWIKREASCTLTFARRRVHATNCKHYMNKFTRSFHWLVSSERTCCVSQTCSAGHSVSMRTHFISIQNNSILCLIMCINTAVKYCQGLSGSNPRAVLMPA
jgi:hypothetical protein